MLKRTEPYVRKKFAKNQRRAMRRGMRRFRETVSRLAPRWMHRAFGPSIDRLDMLLLDHGIFRAVYSNTHRLSANMWRTSQPAPHHLRRLAGHGVKTIINLRGERDCGSYRLEVKECARLGIELIDFPVKSRAAPLAETVREAQNMFDRIAYPAAMHCKSGADRVGLMSALYLFLREGTSLERSQAQLDWRFGHFRQADTGVLDRFFDAFAETGKSDRESFLAWLENDYDAERLTHSFRASSWANILVNRLLHRE